MLGFQIDDNQMFMVYIVVDSMAFNSSCLDDFMSQLQKSTVRFESKITIMTVNGMNDYYCRYDLAGEPPDKDNDP